jgi:hypothetical protein
VTQCGIHFVGRNLIASILLVIIGVILHGLSLGVGQYALVLVVAINAIGRIFIILVPLGLRGGTGILGSPENQLSQNLQQLPQTASGDRSGKKPTHGALDRMASEICDPGQLPCLEETRQIECPCDLAQCLVGDRRGINSTHWPMGFRAHWPCQRPTPGGPWFNEPCVNSGQHAGFSQ